MSVDEIIFEILPQNYCQFPFQVQVMLDVVKKKCVLFANSFCKGEKTLFHFT